MAHFKKNCLGKTFENVALISSLVAEWTQKQKTIELRYTTRKSEIDFCLTVKLIGAPLNFNLLVKLSLQFFKVNLLT